MADRLVLINAEYGDVRGTLIDFVTKEDKTYGIVKIGNKLSEIDIDKITILDNV